jgi:hypothetical protein
MKAAGPVLLHVGETGGAPEKPRVCIHSPAISRETLVEYLLEVRGRDAWYHGYQIVVCAPIQQHGFRRPAAPRGARRV